MAVNHIIEKNQAVEEARLLVQGLPLTQEEFERAANEVLKTNPAASAQAIRDSIVETALENYQRGSGYY